MKGIKGMSLLAELKNIEKEIDSTCFTDDQVSFCFCCDIVSMDLSDLNPLKDTLVKNKVISSDDVVTLTKVDAPTEDVESICEEWHFKESITSILSRIVENADGYYRIWADGTYASYGYLWSTCRLLQKGNEFYLLEFYICD